jgi:transmembrane 9 superfamily protein 2/4
MGGTVQEFMELSEERSLGWKQHQREVFRPPRHKFVLSALFGAGVQAMLVIFLTLGRMAIKNYHYFEFEDSNILLWWRSLLIVTSVMGGYSATRVYKMWGGQNWMANSLVTSLILPITLTLSLSIENSMRLLENALSYSIFEMFYLPVLWLAAAIPLGMIGSAYGYKRKAIKNPFNFHAV